MDETEITKETDCVAVQDIDHARSDSQVTYSHQLAIHRHMLPMFVNIARFVK